MAAQPIELVYVGYRSEELRQVLDAGVRTFLVDREWRGKERRQLGQDTEIDVASRQDLAAATALLQLPATAFQSDAVSQARLPPPPVTAPDHPPHLAVIHKRLPRASATF